MGVRANESQQVSGQPVNRWIFAKQARCHAAGGPVAPLRGRNAPASVCPADADSSLVNADGIVAALPGFYAEYFWYALRIR